MKIAVCFCGQIRTGVAATPNIKRFIGDLWDQCDFFIHTWNYETSKGLARKSLKGQPIVEISNRPVHESEIFEFADIYQPKKIQIQDFDRFRTDYPATVGNVIWYTSEQVLDLRRQYEIEQNQRYDLVIKMRPDIIYPASRTLSTEVEHFMKNPGILYSDIYTRSRLDDVFWLMSSEVADKFQGVSGFIDHAHVQEPRNCVLKFLKIRQIHVASTAHQTFQYAVFRRESQHRDPLTQYKEIFRDDIYYYSHGFSEEELDRRFLLEDLRGIRYD